MDPGIPRRDGPDHFYSDSKKSTATHWPGPPLPRKHTVLRPIGPRRYRDLVDRITSTARKNTETCPTGSLFLRAQRACDLVDRITPATRKNSKTCPTGSIFLRAQTMLRSIGPGRPSTERKERRTAPDRASSGNLGTVTYWS